MNLPAAICTALVLVHHIGAIAVVLMGVNKYQTCGGLQKWDQRIYYAKMVLIIAMIWPLYATPWAPDYEMKAKYDE